MKKITLFVDKRNFVDWYFDKDMIQGMVDDLIRNGIVTLKDCLHDVGYLPLSLIINKKDVRKADIVDEREIEEPGQIYDLKFKEEMIKMAIKPKCKLIGEDGNVINIMRRVNRALIQADLSEQAKEFVAKAIASKSYEDVLALCHEYVEVI